MGRGMACLKAAWAEMGAADMWNRWSPSATNACFSLASFFSFRAIQESMFLQSGPALGTVESGGGNSVPTSEDSPVLSNNGGNSSLPPPYPSFDEQLRLAMELSSREQEERERQRREEDEELQRILQLSLTEK